MSAAAYPSSYQLPAGILALAVHGAFFALLYFGFTWQTQAPAAMSVTLWQRLPDEVPAIVPPAPAPPAPPIDAQPPLQPVPPVLVSKPDIVLQVKKIEPKKLDVKKTETPVVHPAEPKKNEVKVPPPVAQASAADVEADRQLAAQAAAVSRLVDEYSGKIQSKIKRNIVINFEVANDARAEFSVTVLPDGSVLPPRKIKSSGNVMYDDAVERAILKSQPLPLPPDAALARSRFRDLKLGFQPKE